MHWSRFGSTPRLVGEQRAPGAATRARYYRGRYTPTPRRPVTVYDGGYGGATYCATGEANAISKIRGPTTPQRGAFRRVSSPALQGNTDEARAHTREVSRRSFAPAEGACVNMCSSVVFDKTNQSNCEKSSPAEIGIDC